MTPKDRREWAEKFEINEQYLYQCLTGRKEMKSIKAARIERESNGVITRQMLCHKTWAMNWPELAKKAVKVAQKEPVVN